MAKDPAFLLYSSDFLTGTMFFTDEEVGIYLRLLLVQHQQNGSIDEKIFNSKVPEDSIIRKKFKKDEEGFYNQRLLDEMIKREKKCSNLSENAKKRWSEAKQLKSKVNAIASQKNMQTEIENKNTNKDKYMTKDMFEMFWDKYPKKTDKKKAKEKFLKLDSELFNTIMYALDYQIQSTQWKEGYIPNPTTWINGERWEDKLENEKPIKEI